MDIEPNRYSATWFKYFLDPVPSEQTEREVEFIARQLPRPQYHTLLDIACGPGRHAWPLSRRGYRVTGVDANADAIAQGKRWTGREVEYVLLDMRKLDELPAVYDAAIIMWQSFGYFDDETNLAVLRQIAQKLNPHGRLILDLYHRAFFEQHEGMRTLQVRGLAVTENRFMRGDRLQVTLDYGADRPPDAFEWRLYTPEELGVLAQGQGFRPLLLCSDFDERQPPAADKPRWQVVLGVGESGSPGV